MHSVALLLPALSLLASAQAWSPFSSSSSAEEAVVAPIVKRANPDLGIQTYYGNVGSGYATFVGCDGNGNYVAGDYSYPISYGLYPALQASCDDQSNYCTSTALGTRDYTYYDCIAQANDCRNNQYLAVNKYAGTSTCPMSPAIVSAISVSSVRSVSSVSTRSVASTASVASVSLKSAATTASIASVASASVASVRSASTLSAAAASVASASVASVSSANAYSASISSVSSVSAASLASVASVGSASVQSVAATSSAQAAAASQSQANLVSASLVGAQSALSVSSTASVAAAAAAATQASLASVSGVAAQSVLSVASTASAQVAAASQSQAALASQSALAVQSLAAIESQAAAASQSLIAVASQSNLAVQSAQSVASVASAQVASASQSAQSILSVASVSRVSVSAAAASASAAAAALVLPAGYKAASTSLISEGVDGARALAGASTSSDSMTPSVCALYCTAAGFAISGTEFGSECYCSNSLDNGASLTSVSTSSAYPCSGAASQVCGGFSALSIAYNTALATLTNNVFTLITVPVVLPSGYTSASSSLIAEGPNGRALTGPSFESAAMTPTLCGTFCTTEGYAVSGVEYSTQCFCGQTLSNGASLSLLSTTAPMACGGAAAQTCGGTSALSIAYNTALATLSNGVFTLTKVATVTLPSGYSSASSSLIAEGPSGRALTGAFTSSSSMTPSSCATYCTAAGFALSGTEYSTECYCGNALSNGASLSLTSSASSMACGGDSTQTCGGASALSIVYNTALATVTNGVVTLTSVTAVTLPAGYASASASLLPEAASGRVLTGASTSSSDMTPSTCATYCTSAGFAISGTEYGSECYCGNSLSNGVTLSSTTSAQGMACSGDSTQVCGGFSAISVVYNTALASLSNGVLTLTAQASLPTGWAVNTLGSGSCVAEPATVRALSSASYEASDMTVESCLAFCDEGNYPFAGVEYSTQCYCGLVNAATESSTGCNMPCGGDSTQTCGGSNAVSVYFSASNFADAEAPAASTSVTLDNGFSSTLECWSEVDGRLMTGAGFTSDVMTYELCTNYCSGAGFTQAGVEWGRECYCSSSVDLTKLVENGNCNVPCSGAPSTICGGAQALQIFTTTAAADTTITLANGWTSDQSCLAEVDGRLFTEASMSDDAMTPTMCTDFCASKGANQSGVEYGTQCYCASGVDLTKAVKATNCDMACAGDQTTVCGGSNALNVYTTSASVTKRRYSRRQ